MTNYQNDIEFVASENDISKVKEIIEAGANQDTLNAGLSCAVAYAHVELADYLIEQGANLTHSNYDPLYWACHNDNEQAIKYVLSKGIDININDGMIIWLCADRMSSEFIQWLLENGADPSVRNGEVLIQTAEYGDIDVLKILLEKGSFKRKVINSAKSRNRQEIVKILKATDD